MVAAFEYLEGEHTLDLPCPCLLLNLLMERNQRREHVEVKYVYEYAYIQIPTKSTVLNDQYYQQKYIVYVYTWYNLAATVVITRYAQHMVFRRVQSGARDYKGKTNLRQGSCTLDRASYCG